MSEITADRVMTQRVTVSGAPFLLVPADRELLMLERQREQHSPFANNFRAFLRSVDHQFDACIVDTNPNPDIRLISALASADLVLAPIQLTMEAMEGIYGLLNHDRVGVRKVKALLNPKLDLIGILPMMVEATPFQRANLVEVVERYMPLLIRLSDDRADFANDAAANGDRRGAGRRRRALGGEEDGGARLLEGDRQDGPQAGRHPFAGRAGGPRAQAARERVMLETLDLLNAPADLLIGAPMLLLLDSIDEDPDQPRKEFDPDKLAELAETIRERGVRQPVSVRRHPQHADRWILNFGARRLRASRLVGKTDIPAFVDNSPDSYDQVIENEQRENLTPLDLGALREATPRRRRDAGRYRPADGQEPRIRHHGLLDDRPARRSHGRLSEWTMPGSDGALSAIESCTSNSRTSPSRWSTRTSRSPGPPSPRWPSP